VTQQIVFEIEQRGDVYIIRIGGRLATGANIDLLQTKAQTIKSLGCTKLIADICELDSIGSEGIAFFVDLYKSTTKDIAGRFVLASPSPRVLEVLTLTGLSTIIPFVNDLAAALTYCAREENKTHQAASSLG
jgi:anti-anti-sigma factor